MTQDDYPVDPFATLPIPLNGGAAKLVPLAALALAAIVPFAELRPQVQHPNERYVEGAIPVTTVVRFGAQARTGVIESPRGGGLVIGVEDAPPEQVFGEVTDVAFLSDGTIAVLDGSTSQIRLFDSSGTYVGSVGRSGDGPGEFRNALAIAVGPDDDLWVADAQRRLNVFSRFGSGYRIRRSLRVDVAIRDMCFLGATLVAHAPATTDSHALAVLDTTGQVSSRFGAVYRSSNGLVNYTLAQGRIACDIDSGLIVYGPRAGIGEVRSYRRDGSPVWRVRLATFAQT